MIHNLWHLLAESAARTPEATAVRAGGEQLSYRELDDRSNKLASCLIAGGLSPGDRVGLFFPKSAASLVAIFGILKAGGVYVPIDPASPLPRLTYMVRNCGVRHIVTTAERVTVIDEAFRNGEAGELAALLLVDSGVHASHSARRVVRWSDITRHAPQPALHGVETDLAYILYTSGSTGQPKGVMITHRAALTFIDWTHEEFAMSSRDVVSSHAPLHFDLSIFELFTTIKAGGTIVVVPERFSTFPIKLAEFIREERISVWYSVPSALSLMLQRGRFADHAYPDLRVVLFAGEVFPSRYLSALRRTLDAKVRLYNLYGPTETNVCTYYEVTARDLEREAPVPIGRPIRNYDVFAVNESGVHIGHGEGEGELFARGPGLMAGYWGDAEKTMRVLRPHTGWPSVVGDRVMATGDIVTLDENGDFVYIGRRDSMVKSRGYRIELGEIEVALYRHPRVREAAVVAVPDALITNRLSAFVACDGEPPTVAELQELCRTHIPRYMVPETIEFLTVLPKTSTGKIDRRQLANG